MCDIEDTFELVEMPESDDKYEYVWSEMYRKLKTKTFAKLLKEMYQQKIQSLEAQNKSLKAQNQNLFGDLW